MNDSAGRVIVFSRAPVPGQVKTRLLVELDAEQAAELYRRLLERTMCTVAHSQAEVIELCCSPDIFHPVMHELAAKFGAVLTTQFGADVGARMDRALTCALALNSKVVLVGCDCPTLSVTDIDQALRELDDGCDVVVGPAEDGGYYLIGMRRACPQLFTGIPWGTDQVLRITLERVATLGLQVEKLPLRWDVDRPADLDRLRALARNDVD